MKTFDRYAKVFFAILFVCVIGIGITMNIFILSLYGNKALHLILTILLIVFHIMLYYFTKYKYQAIILLIYWIITLLLRIYVIAFLLIGFIPLNKTHPHLSYIMNIFPSAIYFPGAWRYDGFSLVYSTILLIILSILFIILHAQKISKLNR